jgi:hypothetical protein
MVQAAGVRTYPEGLEACGSAACSLGGVAGPSYSRHCARPLAHRPCRRAVGRARTTGTRQGSLERQLDAGSSSEALLSGTLARVAYWSKPGSHPTRVLEFP